MGHIKISQIRIHLIKNVEKYIGTCITHFLSHIFRKPNLSSIIKLPHNRHGEGGWIPWLLIGDGEHEGKSGFVSHTKLTAEATFMDLFHS